MTELKTLKDMEEDNKICTDVLTIKNIRKEAIKWVKYFNNRCQSYFEDSMEYWVYSGQGDFIQKFFNITEKDLEESK